MLLGPVRSDVPARSDGILHGRYTSPVAAPRSRSPRHGASSSGQPPWQRDVRSGKLTPAKTRPSTRIASSDSGGFIPRDMIEWVSSRDGSQYLLVCRGSHATQANVAMDAVLQHAKHSASNELGYSGKITTHYCEEAIGGSDQWPEHIIEEIVQERAQFVQLRDGCCKGMAAIGIAYSKLRREQTSCLALLLTAIVTKRGRDWTAVRHWPFKDDGWEQNLSNAVALATEQFDVSRLPAEAEAEDVKVEVEEEEEEAELDDAEHLDEGVKLEEGVDDIGADDTNNDFVLASRLIEMEGRLRSEENLCQEALQAEERAVNGEQAMVRKLEEEKKHIMRLRTQLDIERERTQKAQAREKAQETELQENQRCLCETEAQLEEVHRETARELKRMQMQMSEMQQEVRTEACAAAKSEKQSQKDRLLVDKLRKKLEDMEISCLEMRRENIALRTSENMADCEQRRDTIDEGGEEANEEHMKSEEDIESIVIDDVGDSVTLDIPETTIEWMPNNDASMCLCVCRYTEGLEVIFQGAKSAAKDLLGFNGKISDHVCEVGGGLETWPVELSDSEIAQHATLRDGPFEGYSAVGCACAKDRRERGLCLALILTAATYGSKFTQEQIEWLPGLASFIECGIQRHDRLVQKLPGPSSHRPVGQRRRAGMRPVPKSVAAQPPWKSKMR